MLWASQVAVGCENGLQLRVYGDKAGLEWRQDNPNQMWFTEFGRPKQLLTRGGAISGDTPPIQVRLPSGHPEGYLEAFATLYSQFAQLIRSGDAACPDLPSLADGIEGMEFIAAAVRSSDNQSMWTSLSDV
jgi:predicted dehydrogenase